jgi:hypothetical protein
MDFPPTIAYGTNPPSGCDLLGSRTGPMFCALPGLRVGGTFYLADFELPDGTRTTMNGKVLRKAKLSEVRELQRQHPKPLKLKPNAQWFEIHID